MENSFQNLSRDSEKTQMLASGGSASFEPGTILLEKFRVVEHLGAGGMGNVYRVDHLLLEKPFAFKCLNKFQEADASWKRFQNEAKAAQLLDHPNLLKVFEFGLLNSGQPFFLMELIEGKTLADEIKSLGHLPTQRAVSLFIQVAFAIACAHNQKIVHRDLKPSNIMLVPPKNEYERESVKVVDFGIAKLTGLDEFNQQTLTRTGEIFGSPFYMSPEQCMGLPVDHRSDLYSLGCVFYETLTSAPPFMGETALSTMMKHQADKQLSLKEASLGETYPAELERIIEKLLEKDPEKRYQTADHLARDLISLERNLKDEKTQAASVIGDATSFRPKAPPAKPSESKGSSNSLQMIAIGALLYILGVGRGYMYFKSTAPAPAEVKEAYPEYWSEIEDGQRKFNFPDFPIGTLINASGGEKPASRRIATSLSDDFGLVVEDANAKYSNLLSRFRPDDLAVLSYDSRINNSSVFPLLKKFTGLRCLNVSGTTFGDRDLEALPYLKKLIYLNLCMTNVDCAELAKYNEIYNLQFLDISHLNRPADIFKLLPNFKNLQQLACATCALSDKELKMIGKSKTIRVLNIAGNMITDQGIKSIEDMQSLEWLDLSHTKVTAKCLGSLVKLKKLRLLEIVPSEWPIGDVNAFPNELRKANPGIQISYVNRGTFDPSVLLPFKWGTNGLMTHSGSKQMFQGTTLDIGDPIKN